jgi:DnaK suppressor protein
MKHMNDETLRAVRARLLTRGAELRERRERVQADLRREREALPKDSDDAAIHLENDEVLEAIDESARAELASIDAALARLDAGQFARCERCGGEIEIERLQAVAHASTCSRCAREG